MSHLVMISPCAMTCGIGAARAPAFQTKPRTCSRLHQAAIPDNRRSTQATRRAPSRQIRAASSDDSAPAPMSVDEAAALLEVGMDATFDEIVAAKNAKLGAGMDETKVEAAYDALLMLSMKKRLSGNVDTSVRFADVPKYRPPPPPKPSLSLPGGLSVEQVGQDKALVQAGVFATFAAWALIQGITDSPAAAQADVAGLQLGLALAASVYFLRENKSLGLGRSAAITGGGLLVGALLGGALQAWLQVDIVPIGSFSSPGVLVSEFAILGVWGACTFLA